jgi:hypothetical protein
MGSFQRWLDRANERYGGIGAVVTATLLVLVLFYALVVILGDFW